MKSKEPGTIRQLFAFVGESNGKMRLSIFLAVLGELFGMGPFLMVAVLADALYWGTAAPTLVLFLCGGAAVCQIIKMLLTWRSSLMSHKISFTILKNIREAITDRMAKVPMGIMLETPTGAFKNLIVDNVAKLEDSMAHFMPELPSNIAAPLCSILLIFLLDWRMGLAALVTIPLGALFFAAMMRGYGPRMENYMRSANEMNSALVEYVNGIQVIKAFNRVRSFLWKVCRFCPLFPRFHHGMVEPVLALERGSPSGPPFYASGNPSSGSVALHGGKSFSPCLSGGLGGASGFYCAADEGLRGYGAGQHDQRQPGTSHHLFENTGACPPHRACEAWGAVLINLRMSILLTMNPKFSTVSHSRHSPVP